MIRSLASISATVMLALAWPATAAAIAPPAINPAALPPDTVSPETDMEQREQCAPVFARDGERFADPPWTADQLRLDEARKWSTGDGVLVAVIDTGVNPSPRVPAEPGGDYIIAGDGLSDCDAHGTLVASLIAARPADGDKIVGVAPGARILSIRQTSRKFSPRNPQVDPNDPQQSQAAGSIRSLARAVVHAANMGARVINISETVCLRPIQQVDQAMLGAALRYAVVDKDAVVVTAAGNTSDSADSVGSCNQNPPPSPAVPIDAAGWGAVSTIVSPAWFAPLVLTVGATTRDGGPAKFSMAGPWAGVAAPGDDIIALADGGRSVNAYQGKDGPVSIFGTSFSTAFVSGTAALVRAKYPTLSANQVMDRIIRTARHPGTGWDDVEGFGPVDPVAALTWNLTPGPLQPAYTVRHVPAPISPRPADRGAVIWVVLSVAGMMLVAGGIVLTRKAMR